MPHWKLFIPLFMLLLAQVACIPPQDCGGVNFTVKGTVKNEQGQPLENVTVRVYNNGSYELPPFDVTVASNSQGYFETEQLYSYGCTEFMINFSSKGYVIQELTYYPHYEAGTPAIPEQLNVVLVQNR